MKKIYYLLLTFATISLTGCNDWLDVSPRSQIKSDVLFQTEEGFKQALNGVYIKLGQATLYGNNTSMYIPETLAQMWKIPSKNSNLAMYSLGNYDFTESNTETTLSDTFKDYYNAIAQLNDILTQLKSNKDVKFEYNNDKLIEGEILGLRAFLHLDILRFWGPVPENAINGESTIPYVTEITNDISKLSSKTWEEVLTALEQDLNNAETLLEIYDPIVYANTDSLNYAYYVGIGSMPKDEWQMMRKGRFNYYAVLGAKARFYHWINNKELAIKYSKMVINANKMPLCTESSIQKSLTMYPEHLFGIENVNLLDLIQQKYSSSNAIYTQTKSYVEKCYENNIHANDIRYTNNRYWKEEIYDGINVNTFYKYIGNDKIGSDKRIPLLRMAEMYLILIENLTLEEAKTYFTTYRISRGLSASIDESSMSSNEARLTRLEKEYLKEFFGEGQMFFFYKKHNYKKFNWPKTFNVPTNGYIIPKPKGLSNFE